MSKVDEKAHNIVNGLIKKIDAGLPPWNSPYLNSFKWPQRHTGERYQGINAFLLLVVAMEKEYKSPFWFSYKQAKTLGAQVRKGEKATPIFFYKHVNREDPTHPRANENGEVNYKFMNVYSGFNGDQIENLPAEFSPIPDNPLDLEDNETAITILTKLMRVPAQLKMSKARPSYFNFIDDYIHMTEPTSMKSDYRFSSTLAHELIHWCGHESRLNRNLHTKMTEYEMAFEELVAEIGACMLCLDFGINPKHADNHASYLAHYSKILKHDHKLLFKAAAKAQESISLLKSYWTENASIQNSKITALKQEIAA